MTTKREDNFIQTAAEIWRDQKKFKQMMRDALKHTHLVYPNVKLGTWGSGITLLPSPTPVQKTQVLVSLPRKQSAS